jgi:hypothetical protein
MNRVNEVLDEFESVKGRFPKTRTRKAELLNMARLASARGMRALYEDARTREPTDSWDRVFPEIRESMRQDKALIDAFVEAECRLLRDFGVDRRAVARIRTQFEESLNAILSDPAVTDPARLNDKLASVTHRLNDELELSAANLSEGDERTRVLQLRGVLLALGGGLVLISNGLILAGLTPVTGGVAAGGAAVSAGVGQEMMSRGLDRAFE